ncbi:MAG: hypothetical protein AB1451_13915 [Nitrospirota bacterium]
MKQARVRLESLGAFLGLILLAGCNGGGGSSSPAATTVTGTAATGAAIVGATISIKDAAGDTATATTGTDGTYSLDVTGMTPPFLLQVDVGGGSFLYSVGETAGTVNVHPLTDLIIRTWYEVQGDTIDAAFADPTAAPPPSDTELQVIVSVVENLVKKWLVDAGLDPAQFDMLTTPFDADSSGFDGVLDVLQVDTTTHVISLDDGTSTQQTDLTISGGTVTASTTVTENGITSTSFTSAYIPTTPEEQAALDGVLATLQDLANTANTKGDALTAADLLPFYDADYLSRGLDENQDAEGFAQDFAGVTFNAFRVDHVVDFDAANNIIGVAGAASLSQGAVTVDEIVDEDGDGLIFKKQSDGRWLFYGNQERARAQVGLITERRMLGTTCQTGCDGVYYALKVQVGAPVGVVQSAAITGPIGGTTQTIALTKNAGTFTDGGVTTEHFDLVDANSWWYQVSPDAFPPAGTEYTIEVTFSDSTTQSYTRVLEASTTEAFDVQAGVETTVGHSASATLGSPVTLAWNLPVTFPIEEVSMYGFVKSVTGDGCDIEGPLLSPTATSGTITLPTTCNGNAVEVNPSYPSINVVVSGTNGEETDIWYAFQ